MNKPLGRKNYGSIPHLPGSRLGPGDHHIHEGQGMICCERVRDLRDVVIVTEKLDGSNVGIARIGNDIIALGRAGYPAQSSPWKQHQYFAAWVRWNESLFREVLHPNERIVGEWLAQAHGTRYSMSAQFCPFVAFDLMEGAIHLPYAVFTERCSLKLTVATCFSYGGALPITKALHLLGDHGFHGAMDLVEGAVWRVERDGNFEFMAKYVRPEKIDGYYLPERSGKEIWNWKPNQ